MNNDYRDKYNEKTVAEFIETVLYAGILTEDNPTWNYHGVIAKKIDHTSNCDVYLVHGNVEIENTYTKELIWKTFTVNVYVYKDDITTLNWKFN